MEKFDQGGRQNETLENHVCRINPFDPREGSNDRYKYFGCAFPGCDKTVTYVTSEGTNTNPVCKEPDEKEPEVKIDRGSVWKLEEGQYDNNPEIGDWRARNTAEGDNLLTQ